MRRLSLLAIATLFSFTSIIHFSQATERVDIDGTFVNGDLTGFYLGVGEYFKVPQQQIVVIQQQRIPPQEIPVVLYLAQQARVNPDAIVSLRLSGRSWLDITLHFGLTPDIYYAPIRQGPPYGKAYGYYKNKTKLSNNDIIILTNTQFIAGNYRYSPDYVFDLYNQGNNFITINNQARTGKNQLKSDKQKNNGNGNGNGKNKDKGQGNKD